jgi:hypothetical protein
LKPPVSAPASELGKFTSSAAQWLCWLRYDLLQSHCDRQIAQQTSFLILCITDMQR